MTLPEIGKRNGESSKYRKKVYEIEFPLRAGGSEVGPNRSTSGFYCSKMTSPGGPSGRHFGTGKDCDSVISAILRSLAPPRKNIWSRFSQWLSDSKLRSLFCTLLKIEKTLLCVVEMRKGPFRVRRPGARIGLFPRRN